MSPDLDPPATSLQRMEECDEWPDGGDGGMLLVRAASSKRTNMTNLLGTNPSASKQDLNDF